MGLKLYNFKDHKLSQRITIDCIVCYKTTHGTPSTKGSLKSYLNLLNGSTVLGELSDIQRKKISWDKIEAVCTCLGNRSLAVICRRLALDYRYNHSGFPDLTMWNVHNKQVTDIWGIFIVTFCRKI